MERIWLANYPEGIPAEAEVDAFRNLCEVFEQSVARYGPRLAFTNLGSGITYRELDRLSRNFAGYLQSVLRMERGARVALMMPNVLQYPVALFGALRAGCVVVNCNPLYTRRELHHQLRDSGAELVVVLENFASVVQEALPGTAVRHVVVTPLGELLPFPKGALVDFVARRVRHLVPPWRLEGAVTLRTALRLGELAGFQPVPIEREDLAFLQYTGGTTGVPKGAMLSHGNIVANLQQAHAWLRPVLSEGREVVITALPLYHVFALTANCMMFLKIGATNVLVTNPRDIAGFVHELARQPFSVITGVNTLFNALLNHPQFARLDFGSLRVAVGGGMAVQRAVAERWKQVTGHTLVEVYGLTETSPGVAMNPLDLAEYNGAVGLPIPSTEVAIRDDAGRDLPCGEVGELCVRGPQVMRGYWHMPAETGNVMTDDGFLRTGDLASMDEQGYVRIVDRKKDMIIVSGFKVFPNEVEGVLAACPDVLEAVVFGVPDAGSGQAVWAAIVPRSPQVTEPDILAYCRRNLTGYKVPRHIEFRSELPKSLIGKVLRRALAEAYAPQLQPVPEAEAEHALH